MAIICALRFDAHSGAMVADEAYWYLRRRKSFFMDNLYQVIDNDIAEDLGIEAAYGSWGHPHFHHEVVTRTQAEVRSIYKKGAEQWVNSQNIKQVARLGRIMLTNYHKVIRRRVDETLRFLYGFTTSDLTRGFYEENGQRYDIAQDAVKGNAMKTVTWSDKRGSMNTVFENRGVLMGYDPEDGFTLLNFNGEKHVICLVSGGFEAVGRGQYASAQAFARFLNHKFLASRRDGVDRIEGMVQVIHAARMAGDYYHEAGGNLSIVYLNGKAKTHAERYTVFTDDRAKLASELVRAFEWQLLAKKDAYELLEAVLFLNANPEEIETQFNARVTDHKALDLLLRGYKHDWTKADSEVQAAAEPVQATAGRPKRTEK